MPAESVAKPSNTGRSFRPVDLARAAGLSAQTVRNYEAQRVIAASRRTPAGYRTYDQGHLDQLLAFTTLARAIGHQGAIPIMTAVTSGRPGDALEALDKAHAQLAAGRDTLRELEAVLRAVNPLDSTAPTPAATYSVGELARHVGVTPATLRGWEKAGIMHPRRHSTGHREYAKDDVLDARVAVLLRRGSFPLATIASAIDQIHHHGNASAALVQLDEWRQNLDASSRGLLTASAYLSRFLPRVEDPRDLTPASINVPGQYI
ncbi:MerR family transcriptional regulator [Microbacterium sp. MPKO10]|uniref:MerR family transcriptional regulator n=1 Tax=Microbacterium sp. MPKO10 TaxID=2989818 RepID=UPI00223565D8|nr:MerR family transcriptional regulator [Microbacterium sp. MPKO10]MCW4458782.1 MerR family transcriptional regulator [Microbacterium sp. MPKO10]